MAQRTCAGREIRHLSGAASHEPVVAAVRRFDRYRIQIANGRNRAGQSHSHDSPADTRPVAGWSRWAQWRRYAVAAGPPKETPPEPHPDEWHRDSLPG